MSPDEAVARLYEKDAEISFLRSVIRNMTSDSITSLTGHPVASHEAMGAGLHDACDHDHGDEVMETVALEDLLGNFEMRDEFVNWMLRDVTGKV